MTSKNIVPMVDIDGYLKPSQINILLKQMRNNPRNYLIFYLLAYTGRRISEVLDLKVSDIHFDEGNIVWGIRKRRIKNYRQIIPVTKKRMLTLLRKYIKERGFELDDKLFNITARRCDQIIKAVGKKIGIERVGKKQIHCHHFRHSFIINNIKKNFNAYEYKAFSKRIICHSNTNVTDYYLMFSNEDIRTVLEKMKS